MSETKVKASALPNFFQWAKDLFTPDTVGSLHGKGLVFFKEGRFAEAEKAYEKIIQLDLCSALGWNNKGRALSAMGRHEEALRAYEIASYLDPGSEVARRNRRAVLAKLGRHREAKDLSP